MFKNPFSDEVRMMGDFRQPHELAKFAARQGAGDKGVIDRPGFALQSALGVNSKSEAQRVDLRKTLSRKVLQSRVLFQNSPMRGTGRR